eukprot:TRINITY_DN66824_c9_g3_i2.p1 TRINITY_DN66824_c9_g3~~TRINITY_DN66824_c9_g3_i2.p1  ORF type:complete len:290 (-),score=31.03 TRINITY_DN66824_c9_g3_i2:90-905(-)
MHRHPVSPGRSRPHSPSASIRDRSDLFHVARSKGPVQLMQPPSLGVQGHAIATAMLSELAQMLSLQSLTFDPQHTCVINYEGKATVLITYDPPTERIYVYSPLLNQLPKNPDDKLALYEYLLEGCLLGRDMAGGGVGISLKDGFCLMCTSFDLRNSETDALRSVVPAFVGSLLDWRNRVNSHPAVAKVPPPQPPPQQQPPQHSAPYSGSASSQAPQPPQQQQQPVAKPPAPQVAPPSPSAASGLPMRSKALLIGINYFNGPVALKCVQHFF